MKKTCNGCRALNGHLCGLGYKVERVYFRFGNSLVENGMKPLEECPKPKTYSQLLELTSKP